MKFWLWLLPAIAVCLIAITIYTLVAFSTGRVPIFSFAFFANGVLVFPALVISLAINEFILLRRRPAAPTRTEQVMLALLVGLTVTLVAASFSEDTSYITVFAWPVLLIVAIATTAVLGATNARITRQRQSPQGDGDIDDLFGGGEN